MAVPANLKTTDIAVGNREDLSDTLVRIYADEMPLLAMAGKRKVKAVDHDWLTNDIRQGQLGNSQPEGATARTTAANVRTRLRNKCQIFDEHIEVSGTQESVDKAAIRSEYKEQKMVKTKSLNLDREATYLSAQQFREQTGTDAGQGRQCSGIQCFVTTAGNSLRGAGGSDGAIDANGYATSPTAGTNRQLTEDMVRTLMLGMYKNGAGGNKTALMGADLKEAFTGFDGTVPPRYNVGQGDVTKLAAIDFYRTNHGIVKVQAHQSELPNEVLVIRDEVVKIGKLRGLTTKKLAVTGDSKPAQMLCEETLIVTNLKGLGIIADVTA